jgi:hypothetical protein
MRQTDLERMMSEPMSWAEIISYVTPHVVRIDTPDGGGTGFLCLYNEDGSWAGVATAEHVVARADEWQQPIRISCPSTGFERLLGVGQRVVFRDWQADSAAILFPYDLGLPEDVIPLLPASDVLPVATPIGWLGFRGIARHTACFFSGMVSAVESLHNRTYLVDGVAVNGVSGGPVLYHDRQKDAVFIVGVISAYRPNRQYGESLPGLSVAQDVSHFHGVLQTVRDFDEAQRRREELESGEPPAPTKTETAP